MSAVRSGPWRDAWRRLRARRASRRALRFLVALAVLSALVPLLPLASPSRQTLEGRLAGPDVWPLLRSGFSVEDLHEPGLVTRALTDARTAVFGDRYLAPLFGTDALGRCVLARTLWGARLSLLVGLVASAISMVVGVAYGGLAGYAGRRVDNLMMRIVDVLYALPLMFLVIFVVTFLRGLRQAYPDLAVDQVVALFAVIGAVSWLTMARVVRAQVLSLRSAEFVDAARAAGASHGRVLLRHLLPNVMPVVLVYLTLTVPRVMLFEAFLSFLGLGVERPQVSWGVLAREGFDALTAVHVSWWLIAFPGIFLATTLLAMNVLGDGLRDALDPRLSGTKS